MDGVNMTTDVNRINYLKKMAILDKAINADVEIRRAERQKAEEEARIKAEEEQRIRDEETERMTPYIIARYARIILDPRNPYNRQHLAKFKEFM
jgi:hypothetical protein